MLMHYLVPAGRCRAGGPAQRPRTLALCPRPEQRPMEPEQDSQEGPPAESSCVGAEIHADTTQDKQHER